MEEGSPYRSSDETQFLFLIAAVLLFMLTLRGKDDRDAELTKIREIRQRRISKKKRAKLRKKMKVASAPAASEPSKTVGSTSSDMDANDVEAFKDSKNQTPEREKSFQISSWKSFWNRTLSGVDP